MATIGIAGATGALGKEILTVFASAKTRPDRVLAYASAKTTSPTVSYGDEHLAVDNLDDADLDELDALVLAVPLDVAREVGERAISKGIRVIDASGAFLRDGDVPLVVPWVNPEVIAELSARGVIGVPHAPALLLAQILGPLARAGVIGPVDATVLVPASFFGRDGIDELSRQVVALFNSGTPPRKVFDQGLAFDVIPALGGLDEYGRSEREREAVDELRRLLGAPIDASLTLIGAPLFSGISATVRIAADADPDKVARVLTEGGVTVTKDLRKLPRPRRVDGHPFAHVGRIRRDARGLELWAAQDNLRGAASVIVALCGLLTRTAKA